MMYMYMCDVYNLNFDALPVYIRSFLPNGKFRNFEQVLRKATAAEHTAAESHLATPCGRCLLLLRLHALVVLR